MHRRWLERVWGYGEDTLQLWGGPARISQFPLEEPIVQSQITDRATWKDNPWITEWGDPQGLWDAVGVAFARDATMIGNLTFGRHRTVGEVGDAELTALRLIAPHVRRAVAISHLLEVKTLEALTFASALETLTGDVEDGTRIGVECAGTGPTAVCAASAIARRECRLRVIANRWARVHARLKSSKMR